MDFFSIFLTNVENCEILNDEKNVFDLYIML